MVMSDPELLCLVKGRRLFLRLYERRENCRNSIFITGREKKILRECCAVYREKFIKLRIFIVLSLDVNKVNNSISIRTRLITLISKPPYSDMYKIRHCSWQTLKWMGSRIS